MNNTPLSDARGVDVELTALLLEGQRDVLGNTHLELIRLVADRPQGHAGFRSLAYDLLVAGEVVDGAVALAQVGEHFLCRDPLQLEFIRLLLELGYVLQPL